jgi:hypothetical protein
MPHQLLFPQKYFRLCLSHSSDSHKGQGGRVLERGFNLIFSILMPLLPIDRIDEGIIHLNYSILIAFTSLLMGFFVLLGPPLLIFPRTPLTLHADPHPIR